MQIHARGMIAAGIIFIEPALTRLITNYVVEIPLSYILNIVIIYCYLIYRKREAEQGRLVFPIILVIYVVVHGLVLTQIPIGIWDKFCSWFIGLLLTELY